MHALFRLFAFLRLDLVGRDRPRIDARGRRIPTRNPWTPDRSPRVRDRPAGWARPALTPALIKRINRALDRRAKLAAA